MNLQRLIVLVSLCLCVLPIALLAQNTSIQGIVTRAGSSDTLSKATVEVHIDEANGAVINTITTAEDGRFVFQNVRPGRYRLSVTRQGYIRAPLSVEVAAGQATLEIKLPMTATGAISGRVYDSNSQPSGNLLVQALKASYPEGQRVLAPVQSVTTNDLGEFRLFWLAPGRYYVAAIPPESEPSNIGMFRFGGFGMTMTSGASSRVFFSSANTDPAAQPELARVLESESQSPDRYIPVYFSSTTDEQTASAIDVRAGSDFGGVNIIVTPVRERHVRGVVLDAASDKPAEYPSLDMVDDVLRPIRPREAPDINSQTGAFDITLLPGMHTLVARSSSGSGYAAVRVGDTDVDNVVIRTTPGFNIKGRMTVEGAAGNSTDLGALRMSLKSDSQQFRMPREPRSYSNPLADGSFTLDGEVGDFRVNIAPIHNVVTNGFEVKVPVSLQNAYVKSMRLGNIDVLNSGLHLQKPPDALLEIVLGTNPGTVEGNAGAADITVVLLPDVRRRTELYRTTTSDPSGRYRFERVPPGDYKIFAWSEVENGAWYDPEFMRSYENSGKPVRVVEGGRHEVR